MPVQQSIFIPAADDKCFQDDVKLKETANKYSSLVTRLCADRFIDDLCGLAGKMASNWGYFESEIIFILTKRLEIYFHSFHSGSNVGEFLLNLVACTPGEGGLTF